MNVQDALGLSKPPVAIAFLDEPPAGLPAWDGGAVPAGCVFWREAMRGKAFYTAAADHHNCAVGAYTHGIRLPDLQDTVSFMVENRYIEISEVPGIPAMAKAPAYVAYAPAADAPFPADVVLVAAQPSAAMLLYEAALRAGAANALANILGRPGCAILPLASQRGAAALSFGCQGNRTFTGLPDEEFYFAVPGGRWTAVVDRLREILDANAAMRQFYEARRQQFPPLSVC
jgi:uncharacterized protein (DUF169 family)